VRRAPPRGCSRTRSPPSRSKRCGQTRGAVATRGSVTGGEGAKCWTPSKTGNLWCTIQKRGHSHTRLPPTFNKHFVLYLSSSFILLSLPSLSLLLPLSRFSPFALRSLSLCTPLPLSPLLIMVYLSSFPLPPLAPISSLPSPLTSSLSISRSSSSPRYFSVVCSRSSRVELSEADRNWSLSPQEWS